jgi:hypothetical protein
MSRAEQLFPTAYQLFPTACQLPAVPTAYQLFPVPRAAQEQRVACEHRAAQEQRAESSPRALCRMVSRGPRARRWLAPDEDRSATESVLQLRRSGQGKHPHPAMAMEQAGAAEGEVPTSVGMGDRGMPGAKPRAIRGRSAVAFLW